MWQPSPSCTVTTAPLPQRHLCRPAHRPASSQAPCVPVRSPPFSCPQRQCKLPRQLSAESLARAFAPRRATGGLVRIPPASAAHGGEGRSLGKGWTPQMLAAVQPRPRSRHAGFRCASALRGVAGVATYRFTRSCYTVIQARRLPHSMWQPPRPLAQGEAIPVRFSVTGCHKATALRDPPE
jgi:hypothetical protein